VSARLRCSILALFVLASSVLVVAVWGQQPASAVVGESASGAGTAWNDVCGGPPTNALFEFSVTGTGTGDDAVGTFTVTCPNGTSASGTIYELTMSLLNPPRSASMEGAVTASTAAGFPVGTTVYMQAVVDHPSYQGRDLFNVSSVGPSAYPLSAGQVIMGRVDTDGDGRGDGEDNCPLDANADQRDSDSDGTGDVCDPTPYGDMDGDGVDNTTDNCPDQPNPDQADTDGDLTGDVCDPTPTGDTDGDQDDNATDNCPETFNPNQADTDGDGVGDACDATPTGDSDGDGVDNAIDNCAQTANPDQADTDGDGIGDSCDQAAPVVKTPPNKHACLKGGWRQYTDRQGRSFHNPWQCIHFVRHSGGFMPRPHVHVPSSKFACAGNGWRKYTDDRGRSFRGRDDCVRFASRQR
jgi:hypothetical protein